MRLGASEENDPLHPEEKFFFALRDAAGAALRVKKNFVAKDAMYKAARSYSSIGPLKVSAKKSPFFQSGRSSMSATPRTIS